MQEIPNNFDAIIIGSGMGALTTASLLSQVKGMKVLLLEKHWVLGGQTHEFKRKKYHFDVGVHYIGSMDARCMPRQIFNYITENNLKWNKMPHIFERFVYPDFTFDVPDNPKEYKSKLITQFPDEEESINTYFNDVRLARKWMEYHYATSFQKPLMKFVAKFSEPKGGKELALMITRDYVEKRFKNKQLQAVVCSQWGDFGLPPSKSAFGMHSLIVNHYLYGGFYPEGGAKKIAEYVIPTIEKNGGKLVVNHDVDEIIIKNKKAIGVRVKEKHGKNFTEKTYNAPIIISSTGFHSTFNKLVKEPVPFKEELNNLSGGMSAISLYVGLKSDPSILGVKGENYWIANSYDHDETYNNRNSIVTGEVNNCYLSFPTLKEQSNENHTAEIVTFADFSSFEKWKDLPWKRRGEEYEEIKKRISEGLLDCVEKQHPGFKELVSFHELSTPLTMESFTSTYKGRMYGLAHTPERFSSDWIKPQTPFKGLYITGGDICTTGVVGALMGGVATASVIFGTFGFAKNLYKVKKYNASLQKTE
ncbi:phytoene desaturase family protein [Flammeovirga kamogawensis]|uniref:NAD(P)/FAD-dependent oxidoreductase n=1 Tax=Flammeovirga kamogawensis TaxID=373891 RepID=A0ABX8GVG9_9BACT|nr:NAD(P)/FAD-dependent oxidoreductase [Flammeovirga kamogawensis]MBB6461015.1 phytoene dehydrogenase-like protein [Flammeovirga kamogawensis]QWG07585.1 NAD(P)/FAD-dependent oxidoreductase [Flammeovirga kamogawensis]TRX69397.1 NAD(P)/FAD-dependent oxidoreductase [Flammeovirga kamogawensis]